MKITFSEGLGSRHSDRQQARTFLDHRDSYAYDNDNPSNPFRYLDPPGRTSAKENAGQH